MEGDQSNAGPLSKRHRTVAIATDTSTSTNPTASPQNEGALTSIYNKFTKLVEGNPDFHSEVERMLEDLHEEFELKAFAATRKQENEISCPIYGLSNDEFKHIFGYIGEMQYGFVACTSDRFHQVYLDTFGGEALTSFRNAAVSTSCAKLCLDSAERPKALFDTAARDGKLDVLKWGDKSGYDLMHLLDEDTIAVAALNGHLEVVQYLRTLGISWNGHTCHNAAKNGHIELLKWVRANGCPWSSWTCRVAALNGHLEVLKWARANGCPWHEDTMSCAACNGHFELLKWARDNQCPWDEETCSTAAEFGHLELLKWARSHQCPWDETTCSSAAWNGHLELLKWARVHQCPWNEDTCTTAALKGHLEFLKWARKNGCPWDEGTYDAGRRNGDHALMHYLEDQGCPRRLSFEEDNSD